MAVKELVTKLNEAERNLERAIDALNDAYRVSAPHRVIDGLSWGVTKCRAIRDRAREELEAALVIETEALSATVR
jgi:hypothetical protein